MIQEDQVTAPGALASTSKAEVLRLPPAEQSHIRGVLAIHTKHYKHGSEFF
jgi:hypothetical protein